VPSALAQGDERPDNLIGCCIAAVVLDVLIQLSGAVMASFNNMCLARCYRSISCFIRLQYPCWLSSADNQLWISWPMWEGTHIMHSKETSSTKLEKPHSHFDNPEQVLADPTLSTQEKLEALDALEQDARLLATATEEGMIGGEQSKLRDILNAKEALEGRSSGAKKD
jgi:hypothetical protein